jgi:hypothetical protein
MNTRSEIPFQRQVANCFDVVAIRVENEGSIIMRVIVGAQTRRSVISSPGRNCLFLAEFVHGFVIAVAA